MRSPRSSGPRRNCTRRARTSFDGLDTFDFQARTFYEKRGYVRFGELPDYPVGHTRIFLTKKLAG
ncbi:hypothetical protein DF034_05110 [Burkholderia anthina]|nr:hypothetical protein DF034_05110 [Burkholderia anthina]